MCRAHSLPVQIIMADMADVNNDQCLKKRRNKGEGNAAEARKKLKSGGKGYITASNKKVPAKTPPLQEVSVTCDNLTARVPITTQKANFIV